MRVLPTRLHGFIDYLYAILLIGLPFVWGPSGGRDQAVIVAAGVFVALYSLLTRYELGVVPVLAMPVHLGLDIVAGLFVAALPWLLGFAGTTWVPYAVLGLFAVVAGLITRTGPPAHHGAVPSRL